MKKFREFIWETPLKYLMIILSYAIFIAAFFIWREGFIAGMVTYLVWYLKNYWKEFFEDD